MGAVVEFGMEEPAARPVVVALIAHDALKDELVRLVRDHRRLLMGLRLVATRTTGRTLCDDLDLDIEMVASGPFGGDLQIGSRIVDGAIDALVFLRDPLTAHPHEPDIQALLKVCDVHQVPVATNAASARILLQHLATPGGAPHLVDTRSLLAP